MLDRLWEDLGIKDVLQKLLKKRQLKDGDDGLRRRGHSKDHRPDLPQAVIGLAVTRDGIPVRSWVWPGNTPDMAVVEQVKNDLIGWKLGRVITLLDRGCSQRAGGHYIAGEKMRSGKENTMRKCLLNVSNSG